MIGAHGAHGLEFPARLDLEAHPRRAGPHHGVDFLAQQADVVAVGNADDGAHGERLEPLRDPRSLASERPAARSSASETAISKAAASMRSTAVPPKSWATPAALGS